MVKFALRFAFVLTCALLIDGCGTAAPATPPASVAPAPASPTVAPTAATTLQPTPVPTKIVVGSGSDAATAFAVAEGSLAMSLAEYLANYNRLLDQGQYPIKGQPTKTSDQVYQATPDGADHTILLFIANEDGSVRSVTALSDAGSTPDPVDRGFAQLETLVIWSTAAAAASPNLSEPEQNNLLGTIGVEGGRDFGTYAVATDVGSVRYILIEADEATELIIREAN